MNGSAQVSRRSSSVWIEAAEVKAMHLCDRRVTTIGRITSGPEHPTQAAWSADGRLLSISFGETSEDQGPARVVTVDVQRGAIAELTNPWGSVRRWSPDGKVVVLGRRGSHTMPTRLATFEFR